MNRLLLGMVVLWLVSFSRLAYGDTISVFEVSGNHVYPGTGLSSGPPVSGTISVDVTIGQVTSIDLTAPPNASFAVARSVSYEVAYVEIFEAFSNSLDHNVNFTSIDLVLPAATMVGYAGGYICSYAHLLCGQVGSIYSNGLNSQSFTDGALTPLSAAPEPSSLLLLGTGVVGVICIGGGGRRRPIRG